MSDLDVIDVLRRKLEALNDEGEPIAVIIARKHSVREELLTKLAYCQQAFLNVSPVIVEQISLFAELQLSVRLRQVYCV